MNEEENTCILILGATGDDVCSTSDTESGKNLRSTNCVRKEIAREKRRNN